MADRDSLPPWSGLRLSRRAVYANMRGTCYDLLPAGVLSFPKVQPTDDEGMPVSLFFFRTSVLRRTSRPPPARRLIPRVYVRTCP